MTAAADDRRRATRFAAAVTVLVFAVVVGAGLVGARALYHSTDGRDAGGPDRDLLPMPVTPNVLVGVTGADDSLRSAALLTLPPQDDATSSFEPGGSIIPVPMHAIVDGPAGPGTLAEQFQGNAPSLEHLGGTLLGVSFDHTIVVGEPGMAHLLAAVDEVEVELPFDVPATTDDGAPSAFTAGAHDVSAPEAAKILATASHGDATDPRGARNAAAVWSAIATERSAAAESGQMVTAADGAGEDGHDQAIRAGDSNQLPAVDDGPAGAPRASGEVVFAAVGPDAPTSEQGPGSRGRGGRKGEAAAVIDALLAGPIEVRELRTTAVERVPGSESVAIDEVDARLVLGQISPRNVVANFPTYSVRIVAPFEADDLPDGTGTSADVAYGAIEQLMDLELNVVSVSVTPGEVPERSRIDVVNPDAADLTGRLGDALFVRSDDAPDGGADADHADTQRSDAGDDAVAGETDEDDDEDGNEYYDIGETEHNLAGIDLVVTLGEGYLR